MMYGEDMPSSGGIMCSLLSSTSLAWLHLFLCLVCTSTRREVLTAVINPLSNNKSRGPRQCSPVIKENKIAYPHTLVCVCVYIYYIILYYLFSISFCILIYSSPLYVLDICQCWLYWYNIFKKKPKRFSNPGCSEWLDEQRKSCLNVQTSTDFG